MDNVLAGRAEEGLNKSAVAPAPDNQQVGAGRHLQQNPGGVAVPDPVRDLH